MRNTLRPNLMVIRRIPVTDHCRLQSKYSQLYEIPNQIHVDTEYGIISERDKAYKVVVVEFCKLLRKNRFLMKIDSPMR